MSSRANDRHIIWGDINLDFEDWKDDLSEQYPDLSEEELMQKMYEINADYLDDERMNLNVQLSQPIFGLLNSRANTSAFSQDSSFSLLSCKKQSATLRCVGFHFRRNRYGGRTYARRNGLQSKDKICKVL